MNLDIDKLLSLVDDKDTSTHYDECFYDHKDCAILTLCYELTQKELEILKLKEQIKFITSVHYG